MNLRTRTEERNILGRTYKVKVCPLGSAIHRKPDIDGRLKAELRKVRRGEIDKPDWKRIVS